MNVIIPDTLNGALILSVIDFFLSFVIIAGIGVVLTLLPLLNRFASGEDKHGHTHAHKKKHGHHHGSPSQESTPTHKTADNAGGHIAAITAAVYSAIGPHKIVRVEREKDL